MLQAGDAKKTTNAPPPPNGALRWRIIVAIFGSMGMAIIYGLKVNISVAMVAMVNHTAVASSHGDQHDLDANLQEAGNANFQERNLTGDSSWSEPGGGDENRTAGPQQVDGPFAWETTEQGYVLSAYFVGYFITQIPGGRMAELYSGKWVFLVAVLMNVVGTLLSPILASVSHWALIGARVFEGLGGGVTFPALNVVVSAWAPPQERSTLSSIAFSGASLGTVLSMLSSGLIIQLAGWEWVFYLQGGLALIWCLLWTIFVEDTPSSHRFISSAEAEYIAASQPKQGKSDAAKPPVPWRKILSSVPFLTLAVCHFCNNFGWYMLLVELPLFARSGLGVGIGINTLMSSVPFLANWLWSISYSKALDTLISKGHLSTLTGRKISVGVAGLAPALALVGIIIFGKNVPAVVSLTILAVMLYGSMFSGVFSNQADLAPNFAGTLMALTNMLATIPGILVPTLVGIMTHGTEGLAPWHTVFGLTTGILLFEVLLFSVFGKADIQAWNNTEGSKT